MTRRTAILVAGAAAAIVAARVGIHTPADHPARDSDQAVVLPQAPLPHSDDRDHVEPDPRQDLRALRADGQLPAKELVRRRRHALRAVRAFMRAYLPLEVGHDSAARRRLLASATTLRLAQRLGRAPERPGHAALPDPGAVVGLTGEFDKPPTAFAARVLVDRGGVVSELGLIVRREGRRWLIDDMTE